MNIDEKIKNLESALIAARAFKEGKRVEFFSSSLKWEEIDRNSEPTFAPHVQWRIKPEPKYRAFTYDEGKELIGKWIKAQDGYTRRIEGVRQTSNEHEVSVVEFSYNCVGWYKASFLLVNTTFDDGSKFGVQI
jgi:hypothetical protein